MADINPAKTWGNEDLTPTDLNAEFSNVYSTHVSKSTAQTVSGVKTHSAAIILQDSVNLTFGTGSDATIDYDGTNLVVDPKVVGSGVLSLQGGLTVGVDDTGYDVQLFGATSGAHLLWDESVDTLKLVGGAATNMQGTLTVGVDDTGYDVQFFGATSGNKWLWDESADAMIVVGNATIGTLTAEGDGTLHVHTATAGTVAASTLGDDLIVENSTNAGISILTPNSAIGGIYFGDPQSHYAGQIYYDHANTWMQMRAEDAIWRFNSDGTFLLNETSNANMTIGLTINQGANDNQIACFKSSDINHGWSVNGIGFAHESDDFFSISKASGTIGGVALSAVAEDAAQDSVMYLETIGGTANTGKTTSSRGLISLDTAEHSGSAAADVTANGNVVSISARKSGSWQVVWIVDEDGDYHYDGADGGAFDSYADAELVRAVSLSTSDPAQIARSRWDDMVRYNKDDLVEAKIIGEVTPEEEAQGHRGLVNGAQVQRLHTGAIWQNHVDMLELREVADDLRAELDAERSQRMALEARLNLIEQKGRN